MTCFRIVTWLAVGAVVMVVTVSPVRAQKLVEPDYKRLAAIHKVQEAIEKVGPVDTGPFQQEMPVAKFLEALEAKLPNGKTIRLRIDKSAFGDKYDEIARTPVKLPPFPKKMHLGTLLRVALSQAGDNVVYQITPEGVAITTIEQAQVPYTADYDVKDILAKPELVKSMRAQLPSTNAASQRSDAPISMLAKMLVETILAEDARSMAIELINSDKIRVGAGAGLHTRIDDFLSGLRRDADLAILVQADLFEVNEALYKKLLASKRLSIGDLEKLERQFLGEEPKEPAPKDESLFALLEKQKPVLVGQSPKLDDGQEGEILSWQRGVLNLPTPTQVRKGDKARQVSFEGLRILAKVQASADRRQVWLAITEKTAEFKVVNKIEVLNSNDGKKLAAEIPLFDEMAHTRRFICPDGGSILVPVHYRPDYLRKKERWWVMRLTPRIYIGAEERAVANSGIEEVLPLVVADVLKNPNLKALRDYHGTPGDTRFALLDSEIWSWPEKDRPKVPGYGLVSPDARGKRLLGIRIEQYHPTIRVTLFNAGGSENGGAFGNSTVRYEAQSHEKSWKVRLMD